MTTTRIKVSKTDKSIKTILAATYPEWKGRKVFVKEATSYQMSNYWSEGSRNFVKAYSLTAGVSKDPSDISQIPFHLSAHATVEIPKDAVLVEHSVFCGKDVGVTIYVNPVNLVKLFPTPEAV